MELPLEFEQQMQQLLGQDYASFRESLEEAAPTSIRLNNQKQVAALATENRVPWAEHGYYINERPVFTLDPLFHAGSYYVQEASSMILERLIKHIPQHTQPIRVLDLCAAPGGKTTHLLSLLNEDDILLANEIHPQRAIILEENLTRWGAMNVLTSRSTPHQLAEHWQEKFDIILVDAPCSGEGMFRKDAVAIREWSAENIARCVLRQQEILGHAMTMLVPGGHLIYSTCTYNTKENEDQIEWLLSRFPVELMLPEKFLESGVVMTSFGIRCFPNKVKGEGFFCSMLRKTGSTGVKKSQRNQTYVYQPALVDNKPVKSQQIPYLDTQKPMQVMEGKNGTIKIFPTRLFEYHADLILNKLISKSGIYTGNFKSINLFIPDHELALCSAVAQDLPHLDCTKEQALSYLRKMPLEIDGLGTGYHLVRFEQQALGWIKVIPDRINNLLPHHWRIRM